MSTWVVEYLLLSEAIPALLIPLVIIGGLIAWATHKGGGRLPRWSYFILTASISLAGVITGLISMLLPEAISTGNVGWIIAAEIGVAVICGYLLAVWSKARSLDAYGTPAKAWMGFVPLVNIWLMLKPGARADGKKPSVLKQTGLGVVFVVTGLSILTMSRLAIEETHHIAQKRLIEDRAAFRILSEAVATRQAGRDVTAPTAKPQKITAPAPAPAAADLHARPRYTRAEAERTLYDNPPYSAVSVAIRKHFPEEGVRLTDQAYLMANSGASTDEIKAGMAEYTQGIRQKYAPHMANAPDILLKQILREQTYLLGMIMHDRALCNDYLLRGPMALQGRNDTALGIALSNADSLYEAMAAGRASPVIRRQDTSADADALRSLFRKLGGNERHLAAIASPVSSNPVLCEAYLLLLDAAAQLDSPGAAALRSDAVLDFVR